MIKIEKKIKTGIKGNLRKKRDICEYRIKKKKKKVKIDGVIYILFL